MADDQVAAELAMLREAVSGLEETVRRLEAGSRYRVQVTRLGLTINDAADLAGIGRNEFRELVRSGEVRSIASGRKGGRRVVPVSAVAEYLDRVGEKQHEVT